MACAFLRSYFCLIIWIVLNITIFTVSYHKYLRPQHYYLHTMLGTGLCVSRASAAVVNLNAALVLLPVCRGVNSLIYRTLNRVSRSLLSLWLARLKHVHITLAVTIVISAVIHSAAHLVNSVNFSHHYDSNHPEINWAKYKGQSPLLLVLTSSVGLSGVAMLVILLLMLLLSLKCVRERHYDLFWATHFLFLPFMCLLILHPLSGVLKEQSNYPLHVPNCNNVSMQQEQEACYTKPTFTHMECQGWRWVLAALVVFTADFIVRLCRRNNSSFQVSRVANLPGDVTQFTLTTKQRLLLKPGQYILLQCPRLSSLEWHPFTVTSTSSTSSHTFITVLIRRRGDWTRAVSRLFFNTGNDRITAQLKPPLPLLVDGPFCSPLENILKERLVVCVAAGIGITPFIAALDHLYKGDSVRWPKPCRLHLVWVVRTKDQLTWASDLITAVHHKFWYANQPDRFDVALFVTRNDSNNMHQTESFANALLEKRTQQGRPNWTGLFTEWVSLYQKKHVSVFTCGPQALNKQVKTTAEKFNRKGFHFTCTHESFS